jgi:hypothetical protein
MVQHDNLTVVAIYGHNDGTSAIPALVKSLQELPGSQGLLISPRRPKGLPKHIRHKSCQKMSYQQYSLFTMYCLHMYIKTSHCLIVQDDGWVLNGKNFKPEYYEYDYIGAPCHAGLKDGKLYFSYTWQSVQDPLVVQNGGFSLRSRKFLKCLAKRGLMYRFFGAEPMCNEDVQLTTILRPQLEKLGMKFAPLELSREFSMEYAGPGIHTDLDFSKLLGHHGPTRRLIADNYIKLTKPLSEVSAYYKETEFLDWLQTQGYAVEAYEPS